MTPVDQQFFHCEITGTKGDCQRACIASVLDIPINDVPHFFSSGDELQFFKSMNGFLKKFGLFHIEIEPINFYQAQFKNSADCYHFIYGKSARGVRHAVVGLNGKMVHDPHPSRSGLLETEKSGWTYGLLVSANPAKKMIGTINLNEK